MTITAKIIKDSISPSGVRITTFELEYPRFIHAEFMTHRMFSRNAASSRAIPIERMHELIEKHPAMPVHWGKNQSGMQANEELGQEPMDRARAIWHRAKEEALYWSDRLKVLGVHKQIVNRITEPFQTMKVVCTATEYTNFFWLRNHPDAQPEIQELAKQMMTAMSASKPELLKGGEWHLPYVESFVVQGQRLYNSQDLPVTLEDAKKISASCCAQVSYRRNDDSLEKAKMVFDRLINSVPVHASPVEHQATPIYSAEQPGITHNSNICGLGSGNFYGWIQFRQLIPNQSQ